MFFIIFILPGIRLTTFHTYADKIGYLPNMICNIFCSI